MQDPTKRHRLLSDRSPRTRSVLLATGLLVVAITPFAAAKTGDALLQGKRNGTTVRETEIISNVASTKALKGGYSTRQSNLSASGGGAIYGCRSQAGGSAAKPTPQNPCLRVNNLSKGLAFEFNAAKGDTAGLITVGTGGDTKKPFATNATGVATGLNADRVDGLDASEIVAAARTKTGLDADTVDGKDSSDLLARYAQVTAGGGPSDSRGLIATNPVDHTSPSGIYGVKFTGDLSKCAVSATITGAMFGEITATPAVSNNVTTVTVLTANSAGNPAERAFHLTISC